MDDATLAARIVDLARDVFLESGFDATTMDVVAKRAGISKMTIYRLFESKLALFTAIANAHRQTMMDLPRPDEDCSLAESLLAIFRVDIDPDADRCRGAFLHLIFDEMRRHPELARLMHEAGPLRSQQLLAQWLERQAARGRIVIDDAGRTATILMHMAFGPISFGEDGVPRWPAPEDRKAHVRKVIDLFLHGVVPRSDGAAPS